MTKREFIQLGLAVQSMRDIPTADIIKKLEERWADLEKAGYATPPHQTLIEAQQDTLKRLDQLEELLLRLYADKSVPSESEHL